jgi:8-oxo-dGTP pyrophosphatase MutT (NUDIX family)
MKLVRVAGGIVWREMAAGARIAVVHRARRDDWSLPKGRLEPGETWQQAARREIAEETGCDVRLDGFAGAKLYADRSEPKLVLYWHARVAGVGAVSLAGEVDEVAWLSRREALDRLDHESDRVLLVRALARIGGPEEAGAHSIRRPIDLRSLVVLDSPKAQDALPGVVALISRVVSRAPGTAPAHDVLRAPATVRP